MYSATPAQQQRKASGFCIEVHKPGAPSTLPLLQKHSVGSMWQKRRWAKTKTPARAEEPEECLPPRKKTKKKKRKKRLGVF